MSQKNESGKVTRRTILVSTCGALALAAISLIARKWRRPAAVGHAAVDRAALERAAVNHEVLELDFKGPFHLDQRLLPSNIVKSWINVEGVNFFSVYASGPLGIGYRFEGPTDPRRVISTTIVVTSRDGRTRIFPGGIHDDPRLRGEPRLTGSAFSRPYTTVGAAVDLRMPVSDISRLQLRFEQTARLPMSRRSLALSETRKR